VDTAALNDVGPGRTGRLPENVMHFARLLRATGLPIGSGRVLDCIRALELAGCARREDWYWTMSAVLLSKQEHRALFDQAFQLFWRDPAQLARLRRALPSEAFGQSAQPEQSQRLTDALLGNRAQDATDSSPRAEHDPRFAFSAREVLQRMDFDSMSAAELDEAKRLIARLRLPLPEVRTRRLAPDPHGRRVDLRSTLRSTLRRGGDVIELRRSTQARVHPPLVVLCDISGSMNAYARMFLHFLHALTNDRDRVSVFVFGTRLTNVTRQLRHRDVDVAMRRVADSIRDWSGGTRIGSCLREFNWLWARRTLGQNASVLLVSDGLDREAGEGLAEEMARLHRGCRELIWLNPLLRYGHFEARPAGIRAMLPHVDRFLPVHNLASLIDLARAFEGRPARPAATARGH
jgi:uncharacterized protein with von Willebrand factor type A (vWA) domain